MPKATENYNQQKVPPSGIRGLSLVTGGGGGIGSEICRALARAGYRVVVNYQNNEQKAQATLDSLEGDGHALFKASITDGESLRAMADFVKEKDRKSTRLNSSHVD